MRNPAVRFLILLLIAGPASAQPLPQPSLAQIAREVNPSVVAIEAQPYAFKPYTRSFLETVFFHFMEEKDRAREAPDFRKAGTGVILSSSGLIVTNAHVVEHNIALRVRLQDGRILEVLSVAVDRDEDIAVLTVAAEDLPAIRFGDAEAAQVGDPVIAIGMPLGYENTVTQGIVSAKRQTLEQGGKVVLRDVIQTDAAINPGNSGGPLLNSRGEMVGLITQRVYRAQGLGFAIAAGRVKSVVDALLDNPMRDKLWAIERALGLRPEWVKDDAGERVAVEFVHARSQAARAGLRRGDAIRVIGEHRLGTLEEFVAAIEKIACAGPQRVLLRRGQQRFFTYLDPGCP